MKPFLYTVAQAFYKEHGDNLSHIAFIFPNRRAGIFFQKYLAEVAGHPLFSPPILTVSDFYASLTPYRGVDRISLLCMLYQRYIALTKTDESFDNFLFWGEMLLNDFDDIDKYVVDAQQLFSNIEDIKEIDDRFSYLSDEQIAAVRRFWTNFIPAYESKKKLEFVSIWGILYSLYQELRADLHEQGLAYEGMMFRKVAERALAEEDIDFPYEKVVFVGLNVLTRSEKVVMKRLARMGLADFYWDYESPMLSNDYNKAAYFMKENTILFPSQLRLEHETPPAPQFELIGVPSAVGQTKHVHTILSQLLTDGAIANPQSAINTAIVLPDEQLLTPMLHAIPSAIDPINVTMGYTLQNTAIAGLMESIFDLQGYLRMVKGVPHFYHRKVLSLLTHRFVVSTGENKVQALIDEIRRYNKVYVSISELHCTPLLEAIFQPLATANDAANYLIHLLELLHEGVFDSDTQREHEEVIAEGHNDAVLLTAVEKEFIYHYYITVKRLQEVLEKFGLSMSVRTFFKLLNKLTLSISIPFRGEPLSGLQVMGVLETRALDFENLVILSVNEGVFPVRKVANTFIPYNLRKGFGLSTTDHQDSIYAYYFYRMIYRAKRVYMLYDTRSEGLQSGEVSRYIYQLRYHFNIDMQHSLVSSVVEDKATVALEIAKSETVMKTMEQFMQGGTRALSASALNTYLNCPLQFYLQYVERFEEPKEVAESVEAGTFGSIYHAVMEYIYNSFKGEVVSADHLKAISKNEELLTRYIKEAFTSCYFNGRERPLSGQNFLVGEVIRKYVKKTLEIDILRTPFTYVESERRVELEYPIGGGRQVRLKAFVDRIDAKDGAVRIVDYKTGSGENSFKEVGELFDATISSRPKAVLQVFMYALMYSIQEPTVTTIEPAIYFLRTLFKGDFDASIRFKESKMSTRVGNYLAFDTNFREKFNELLQLIFDPAVPFTQSDDTKSCQYCPFTSLCRRGEGGK